MKEDISNFDRYPHRIFASALLIDGKLVNWKVSNKRWTKSNIGCSNQPGYVLKNWDKIKIRSKSFIVNSSEEHSKVFEKKSVKFYKQFKLHPKYNLIKPY